MGWEGGREYAQVDGRSSHDLAEYWPLTGQNDSHDFVPESSKGLERKPWGGEVPIGADWDLRGEEAGKMDGGERWKCPTFRG